MDSQMIIFGCVGGVIPDVVRIVQNRREPNLPGYIMSPNFWIGLALLILPASSIKIDDRLTARRHQGVLVTS
jgi:hypothetical protein